MAQRNERNVERRDFNGEIVEAIALDFKLPEGFVVDAKGEVIIFTESRTIEKVVLSSRCRTTLAGNKKRQGNCNGFGSDALFSYLMAPMLSHRSAREVVVVRDKQQRHSSRFCSIDLRTHEVTTIDIRGLEREQIRGASFNFPHLYAITEDGAIFHVDMSEDATESTFQEDMASIQWSDSVQVDFRFSNNEVIRADRRVLVARSSYFAAMLNEEYGLAESSNGGVVDLTKSPVDSAAFRAVLAYLMTDGFDPGKTWPSSGSSSSSKASTMFEEGEPVDNALLLQYGMHAIDVSELADQYQLPRLAKLAEAFVLNYALNDKTALQLLARVAGSSGAVERACWSAITDRGRTILETAGRQEVAKFCQATPALAADLLFHAFNVTGAGIDRKSVV